MSMHQPRSSKVSPSTQLSDCTMSNQRLCSCRSVTAQKRGDPAIAGGEEGKDQEIWKRRGHKYFEELVGTPKTSKRDQTVQTKQLGGERTISD